MEQAGGPVTESWPLKIWGILIGDNLTQLVGIYDSTKCYYCCREHWGKAQAAELLRGDRVISFHST